MSAHPMTAQRLPLLRVENLNIDLHGPRGFKRAVHEVSFSVAAGQTVCLVGESGCGKTLTALALLNLLPPAARRKVDALWFGEHNLAALEPRSLARLCGARIAMIFQDPMNTLNPVFPIGTQLVDVLRQHQRTSRAQAMERAHYLLERVGISDPGARLRQYPFELSGGLRQRAMIAMALMCGPQLLIADEPTTALDVTVQAELLALLADIQREFGLGLVFISHDMGLVAHIADQVLVMYAGRIVEAGPVAAVLQGPQHAYTQMLLRCIPQPGHTPPGSRLPTIAGAVPPLEARPDDYSFAHRLAEAAREEAVRPSSTPRVAAPSTAPATAAPALALESVFFHYPRSRLFSRTPGAPVLHEVSLRVPAGQTLGLVGESGSGKSTIARLLLGLLAPSQGKALLDGIPAHLLPAAARAQRIQMVFQDPYGSLNPRQSVAEILATPLIVHRLGDAAARSLRVRRMLDAVGLPAAFAARRPRELSGGQRQRVAIARALMLQPQWLICDEPTSALDVSVQSQILNLLLDLQREFGLGYLFISHNLAVVHHLADEIIVLQAGRVVERGCAQAVYFAPQHAYTRALIGATLDVPRPAPSHTTETPLPHLLA